MNTEFKGCSRTTTKEEPLAAAKKANRIVVFDAGEIIQEGTFGSVANCSKDAGAPATQGD